MNETDIQFLVVCIGAFSIFCLSCGAAYCLIVADLAYQHRQRGGYSWIECVLAAVSELQ
jgi:hypothetical protein